MQIGWPVKLLMGHALCSDVRLIKLIKPNKSAMIAMTMYTMVSSFSFYSQSLVRVSAMVQNDRRLTTNKTFTSDILFLLHNNPTVFEKLRVGADISNL